jgi:two-component system, chemotaxis family, protein-glutamate methylesterase/glutaminase
MTLRVMVVDDSPICRRRLRESLESEGDIAVAEECTDGESACERVLATMPDLVTMDIGMAGMGGLDAIERIMAATPVPILVVTGQPVAPGAELVFEAVRRGALDVAARPALNDVGAAAELRSRVRRLARVAVVRHIGKPVDSRRVAVPSRPRQLVVMGASAGGPAALARLLERIPSDLPACIAIVQHLPAGFAHAFASFVREHSRLRVEVVEDRTQLRPGLILVPPDDHHLLASPGDAFVAACAPLIGGQRPSVDALFRSSAAVFGAGAVGVVLSGIGSDGTAGAAALRAAGALTIAQDEASSAVFGMPRSAIEAGAADLVLGPEAIAQAICEATATRCLA